MGGHPEAPAATRVLSIPVNGSIDSLWAAVLDERMARWVWPAHVDPTVAYHARLHLTEGERVLDSWDVDLRGW